MCYKQDHHVVFFTPYRDTHGIERVFTCTIWDKSTGKLAKGCTVLSLDDEFNREIGKQLSYNKAARALSGRDVHPIVTHKAWESIQALDPSEMRDFFRNYVSWTGNDGSVLGGFECDHDDLTDTEILFFTKRDYVRPSVIDQLTMDDTLHRVYATGALRNVREVFSDLRGESDVNVETIRMIINDEIERINS